MRIKMIIIFFFMRLKTYSQFAYCSILSCWIQNSQTHNTKPV